MTSFRDGRGEYLLEDFNRMYAEYYDPRTNQQRLRLLADHGASIQDALDWMEILLANYEMYYIVHNVDPLVIQCPHLFSRIEVGTEIRNKTTNEVYTVTRVGLDPNYGLFDKTIELEGATAPDEHKDLLEFVDKRNYVRFSLAYPTREAKVVDGSDGVLGSKSNEPWRPTITARIIKREPASIDAVPFSSRKQLKPRPFETFRDPNDSKRYSIQVWRMPFDNLVQFDCWGTNPLAVNQLIDWFETFFDLYTGVFKRNGVQEILYWSRRDNEPFERWRDGILAQSLQMFFRTEKLWSNRIRNITRIRMQLRVAPIAEHVGGGYVTGESTWFRRTHSASGEYLYGTWDVSDGAVQSHDDFLDDGSILGGAKTQLDLTY